MTLVKFYESTCVTVGTQASHVTTYPGIPLSLPCPSPGTESALHPPPTSAAPPFLAPSRNSRLQQQPSVIYKRLHGKTLFA